MSNGFWMDDGQQQQGGWNTQTNQQDMGWGQFDYSQPQQPQQPAGNDYYQQNQQQYQQPQNNYYGGQMFMPNTGTGALPNPAADGEDYENEPPLLEELGINFSHIKEKTIAVLNPTGSATVEVIADQDLAGPLVFCLLFGAALLLHGKLSFGFIYGVGGLGCVGIYALMNLMATDEKNISFTCTASVLGYCLLPMALLSIVTAVLSFKGIVGYLISSLAVLWCSSASSKLFVIALSMDHQRLLVAYPCVLLYSVFALLAIF